MWLLIQNQLIYRYISILHKTCYLKQYCLKNANRVTMNSSPSPLYTGVLSFLTEHRPSSHKQNIIVKAWCKHVHFPWTEAKDTTVSVVHVPPETRFSVDAADAVEEIAVPRNGSAKLVVDKLDLDSLLRCCHQRCLGCPRTKPSNETFCLEFDGRRGVGVGHSSNCGRRYDGKIR